MNAMKIARDRGAMVLIIAHRRSVLEMADHLLVLEAGRPKMYGPAQEVVARLSEPQGQEQAS